MLLIGTWLLQGVSSIFFWGGVPLGREGTTSLPWYPLGILHGPKKGPGKSAKGPKFLPVRKLPVSDLDICFCGTLQNLVQTLTAARFFFIFWTQILPVKILPVTFWQFKIVVYFSLAGCQSCRILYLQKLGL